MDSTNANHCEVPLGGSPGNDSFVATTGGAAARDSAPLAYKKKGKLEVDPDLQSCARSSAQSSTLCSTKCPSAATKSRGKWQSLGSCTSRASGGAAISGELEEEVKEEEEDMADADELLLEGAPGEGRGGEGAGAGAGAASSASGAAPARTGEEHHVDEDGLFLERAPGGAGPAEAEATDFAAAQEPHVKDVAGESACNGFLAAGSLSDEDWPEEDCRGAFFRDSRSPSPRCGSRRVRDFDFDLLPAEDVGRGLEEEFEWDNFVRASKEARLFAPNNLLSRSISRDVAWDAAPWQVIDSPAEGSLAEGASAKDVEDAHVSDISRFREVLRRPAPPGSAGWEGGGGVLGATRVRIGRPTVAAETPADNNGPNGREAPSAAVTMAGSPGRALRQSLRGAEVRAQEGRG